MARSDMGASPLVKLAVTEPALMAVPQSSTTCTTSDVGQASGVVKPAPMEVSTGSSLVGVQPVASCWADLPAVAEGTSSRSTVCVLLSPKVSLMEPRYTPAARLVLAGVTVIESVWPALIALALGAKSKNEGVAVAAPVKVSAREVRLEIAKVCGFALGPVMARKSRPV